MSENQNFGALRVVHVRLPGNTKKRLQEQYPTSWLPEERLMHLLSRRETIIGRALTCDLVLLDPTVSREHVRLVLNEQGWHIYNLTTQNSVRVNGYPVPYGGCLPIQPQDFFVMGSTMLQLIAPQPGNSVNEESPVSENLHSLLTSSVPAEHDTVGLGHINTPFPPTMSPEEQLSSVAHETPTPIVLTNAAPLALQDSDWNEAHEKLLRVGMALPLAGSRHRGARMRWFIICGGLLILTSIAIAVFILRNTISFTALFQEGTVNMFLVLAIPSIPAVGISLLINFIDRFEREPWFLRLCAFLWGAIIAIPLTLFIEQYLDVQIASLVGSNINAAANAILQGLRTGITEEAAKGLGLLLLFMVLRDEFDNVTDGIVYGALVGAGFAMVENFFYFMHSPKQLFLFLILGRLVLGWLCHSTFTVCFGIALGYIRHTRSRWLHIAIPLTGFLAAVGLHAVFDFINTFANDLVASSPENSTLVIYSLVAIIGNYIPPFVAQIVILYFLTRSLAHEVAVIREFLAEEVRSGIVTVDEYALLQHSFSRTKEERRILWRYGWKQWLRVKALYQTEIGLAFRKWHVSMGDKPKWGYIQPEDAYRRRIKCLRQEIMSAELGKK